jgi:hypothetical protein
MPHISLNAQRMLAESKNTELIIMENEITQQRIGEELLFPLFRCLDEGYKKKYVKDIWEQFENNIRASAYTSRLTKFFENITRSMPITLERQYAEPVLQIIQSGLDEDVLTWLRNETTYLVLLARMRNEERKESLKSRQQDLFSEPEPLSNNNETL